MKKRILGVLVVGLLLFSGCSKSNSLEVSGSTSIAPLMEKVSAAYKAKSEVEVNINADGSSAGIKAASEGISQVGMVSRELKDEEKSLGLETHVIALDAIAVVANKENSVKNITLDQLQQIYSGKIKNWKELGGADLPIVVVTREDGSGTRSAFEEIVDLLNDDKSSKVDNASPVIVNSTGAVLENVSQKSGAIGYVSLGSVNNTINTVAIDGVSANEATVKAKTYAISRNFNLVTKDQNDTTKAFIDFILSSEGQKVVVDEGFISIK